ncbi:MAG: DNA-processing protein DprA, partial [Lachnospiraceae bacterium]|nr:DNA-processing protein DprA [Lachnospiraceae bacterium]
MKYTDNEMCTILLSSYIGLSEGGEVKPLSLGEWNKFVEVLVANKLEPSIAYKDELTTLKNIGYDDVFIERIKTLAGRGAKVAFELEEYEKKGINVITFLDKNYPKLLRRELKNKQPPVLFYAGDILLSNKVGIGIVGARKITGEGMQFTSDIVEKAVNERLVIYSGGAKGVDTTAQTVALNNGGAVVSYIADSLISKIKKKDVVKDI